MDKTIIYLVYGAPTYAAEARFSLLTALSYESAIDRAVRYVVYSDRPEAFADLDIHSIHLDETMKTAWEGSDSYTFRLKMCAHRDALARFPGKVVFVDTDTFYRRNPLRLFDKVGPGRSVLHIAEARLDEIASTDFAALRTIVATQDLSLRDGTPITIGPDEMMWNSGVIGLHSDDIDVLDEAIHTVDMLSRIGAARTVNQIEQFASGIHLSRRTKVAEAADTVFHYWYRDIKTPFRERLPDVLRETQRPDLNLWGRAARQAAPTTSTIRKLKMVIRTVLRHIGCKVPGVRTSV